MSVQLALLQSAMYGFGPFFCYPWKPVINYFWGSNYKLGYKHFWDQHQNPTNLSWHLVCLFFQVFSNFAFLRAIDLRIGAFEGLFSAATVILWIAAIILPRECPVVVKLGSVASVLFGYFYGAYLTTEQIEFWGIVGFAFVWILHIVFFGFLKIRTDAWLIIGLLFAKHLACNTLSTKLNGIFSEYSFHALVIYAIAMLLISIQKDPIKIIVAFGSFVSPILGVLINQPILHLFSLAFVATLLQGLAHSLSMEVATLIKLENTDSDEAKIAYEYSHVVNFPNLLLNAIYDLSFKNKTVIRKPKAI